MDKLNPAALERGSHPKKSPKPAPITDQRVALELLRRGDSVLLYFPTEGPEIRKYDTYLPVDFECFRVLRDSGWIAGALRLGYTSSYEYVISGRGVLKCCEWDQADVVKARAIILSEGKLPPEIWCHTFYDHGRKSINWDSEEGVYLVNANGEGFIVFVDTAEVVRHDDSRFTPTYPKPSNYDLLGMTWCGDEQGVHMRDRETGKEIIFFPHRKYFKTFEAE